MCDFYPFLYSVLAKKYSYSVKKDKTMKTELIFFDTPYNSGKLGTLRGLISISVIFPLLCILSMNNMSLKRTGIIFLVSLVLCSCIGVQLPKSYIESIAYSGLIGLSISVISVCAIFLLTDRYKHNMLLGVPMLTAILIASAVVTRNLSLRWKLYGN